MTPLSHSEKRKAGGFTLFEVILSMGILALLSASVYAIVSSSIGASRTAMDEQLTQRRLSSFLQVARDAFLNLPGEGTVSLRISKTGNGEPEPQLVLGKVQGLFGMPSLGGGSVVLAARPRSDGTRTMTLLRIPSNATDEESSAMLNGPGMPLLPKVRKPRWTFLAANPATPDGQAMLSSPANQSQWSEEWPDGSPRPGLVRLEMEVDNIPDPVVAIFYLPPVTPPPAQGQQGGGVPNSGPRPGDTNNPNGGSNNPNGGSNNPNGGSNNPNGGGGNPNGRGTGGRTSVGGTGRQPGGAGRTIQGGGRAGG